MRELRATSARVGATWRTAGALALGFLVPLRGAAEDVGERRWWDVAGQLTAIVQGHPALRSPYSNPALSFGPEAASGWSLTVGFLAGASPWSGGTFVVNPEYANGRGMPNPSGLSGYPNGDIIRVPSLGSEPYFARVFYEQDVPLGHTKETEDPAAAAREPPEVRFMPNATHALGTPRPESRFTITVGKFALTDVFDLADASSDPRHKFMNWAIMNQGAWDYAADTRGYTWAALVALEQPRYAFRAALALMPTTANGPDLDWEVLHARSEVVEGEVRWNLDMGTGSAKLLLYVNHAHMGSYSEALAAAAPGTTPNITSVERVGATKYGAGLLVQQAIGPASAFLRAGWNDGHTETFAFTEIDRSFSAGVEISGSVWGRTSDRAAIGVAADGLSPEHAAYLAAGGHGFQLGDGALSYGWEVLSEAYYVVGITRWVELTADIQGIADPGMNAARGPVVVAGLRLHGHI